MNFLGTDTFVSSVLQSTRLVKRSQALRGRNLMRNSQVEGAPMLHWASGVRRVPEAVSCKSHWTSSPSLRKSEAASHRDCFQYVRLYFTFLRSNRIASQIASLGDRAASSHPFVPSGRGTSLRNTSQTVTHYTVHRGGHPIRPAAQTRNLAMTPDGSVLSVMRARRMFRFGYSSSPSCCLSQWKFRNATSLRITCIAACTSAQRSHDEPSWVIDP